MGRPTTSDAEGITLCSRVHALTVSVWSGVPLSTSPVPFSPSTCQFAHLHAPRIVWPASSRIVWPAFTPQCKPALALALAPAPARPARPRLGAVCVPSVCARTGRRARAFPACPTACSPSRLSLLSGARPAPPRRLIDFRSFSPVTRLRSPVTRRPAIQPPLALPSVAAFPLCAPAKSGALGCSTGAAV
jgi:hypothetical protein